MRRHAIFTKISDVPVAQIYGKTYISLFD